MALTWDKLYSQLVRGAGEKRELISASFELTSRCNLQCKMCYVCQPANEQQAKAKELTTAQWIRLGREARDAGLLFLTLTGGEVFIREDFKEIYEEFVKLGFIITIYTNGTMITADIISWLVKIPPSKVSITLYGVSRETYEKVTGFADGYDRTVRAIDALRAQGIPTEIKTTVVQGNRHDYDQLLDYTIERRLVLGIVNYVSPRREGSNSDPLGNRLSPQELLQYEIHMTERDKQLGLENNESMSKIEDAVLEENPLTRVDADQQPLDPKDAFKCLAGKSAAWITWDGRLLPCGLLDMPETYPLEKGFLAAWEELKHRCTLVPTCKECQECQYQAFCERCPARLLKETGYFDRPAPYLCELAQRRTEYENSSKHSSGLEPCPEKFL